MNQESIALKDMPKEVTSVNNIIHAHNKRPLKKPHDITEIESFGSNLSNVIALQKAVQLGYQDQQSKPLHEHTVGTLIHGSDNSRIALGIGVGAGFNRTHKDFKTLDAAYYTETGAQMRPQKKLIVAAGTEDRQEDQGIIGATNAQYEVSTDPYFVVPPTTTKHPSLQNALDRFLHTEEGKTTKPAYDPATPAVRIQALVGTNNYAPRDEVLAVRLNNEVVIPDRAGGLKQLNPFWTQSLEESPNRNEAMIQAMLVHASQNEDTALKVDTDTDQSQSSKVPMLPDRPLITEEERKLANQAPLEVQAAKHNEKVRKRQVVLDYYDAKDAGEIPQTMTLPAYRGLLIRTRNAAARAEKQKADYEAQKEAGALTLEDKVYHAITAGNLQGYDRNAAIDHYVALTNSQRNARGQSGLKPDSSDPEIQKVYNRIIDTVNSAYDKAEKPSFGGAKMRDTVNPTTTGNIPARRESRIGGSPSYISDDAKARSSIAQATIDKHESSVRAARPIPKIEEDTTLPPFGSTGFGAALLAKNRNTNK